MAGPAAITIRRQVLAVELHGSEAEGLALQRRLPGVCADVVTPALETALGEVDPGDAHLSVATMVIELPDIGLDRLEAELADAVRRAVADHFRRNPAVPADDGAAGGEGAVVRRTVAEDVDDALVAFLRTGRLPWSFHLPSGSRLEEVVGASWTTAGGDRGPPPATLRRLRAVLAEPPARARLARQLAPEPAATILRALSPGLATTLDEVLRVLDRLTGTGRAETAFRVRVWEVAVAAASAGQPATPSDLVRAAWAAAPPDGRAEPALAAALELRWPGSTALPGDEHRGRIEDGPAAPVPPSPISPVPPSATSAAEEAATATTAALGDEDDPLVVDHAGIVLLHPFLPRFFEGLGVSAGEVLVDPDRGVALLHLLATGERRAPE
ncbi:MAG TPA: contractile injection system tape measure protein, partial [Iamia sp.]